MPATLYYVHDPMCSWCWAFRNAYLTVVADLPEEVLLKRVLGGLAPDTDQPMPEEMKDYITGQWHQIQQTVPGIQFNFEFWERCRPRRATYPACRAVIAARNQGAENDEKMTLAIQQAYYLQARNPSDQDTLVALAGEVGLDEAEFAADLLSPETNAVLMAEIALSRQLGAPGFPTLMMNIYNEELLIPVNYVHPEEMVKTITGLMRSDKNHL